MKNRHAGNQIHNGVVPKRDSINNGITPALDSDAIAKLSDLQGRDKVLRP